MWGLTSKAGLKMAGEKNSRYKKEYDELAYNYCLLGAIDQDLATFFEVTEQTINNWKKRHKSFFESIKKGKELADAKVASSLFNRAIGFEYIETKTEDTGKGSRETTVNKLIAGDVTAQIFWLKNRQPEKWRDKQEVKATHSIEDNGSNEW